MTPAKSSVVLDREVEQEETVARLAPHSLPALRLVAPQ